jgi:hypothetical protein
MYNKKEDDKCIDKYSSKVFLIAVCAGAVAVVSITLEGRNPKIMTWMSVSGRYRRTIERKLAWLLDLMTTGSINP